MIILHSIINIKSFGRNFIFNNPLLDYSEYVNLILSKRGAATERLRYRNGVGVFEFRAHGYALRDARHLDAERFYEPREINSRRLALHVGIGRDYDLGRAGQPTYKRFYIEVVGRAVIHRRERSVQYVVHAVERARLF